jgi:hypothetical protein
MSCHCQHWASVCPSHALVIHTPPCVWWGVLCSHAHSLCASGSAVSRPPSLRQTFLESHSPPPRPHVTPPPCSQNLNADPLLSECLVFSLPPRNMEAGCDRSKCVAGDGGGPPASENYMELRGPGILAHHCTFHFDGVETVTLTVHEGVFALPLPSSLCCCCVYYPCHCDCCPCCYCVPLLCPLW